MLFDLSAALCQLSDGTLRKASSEVGKPSFKCSFVKW